VLENPWGRGFSGWVLVTGYMLVMGVRVVKDFNQVWSQIDTGAEGPSVSKRDNRLKILFHFFFFPLPYGRGKSLNQVKG